MGDRVFACSDDEGQTGDDMSDYRLGDAVVAGEDYHGRLIIA